MENLILGFLVEFPHCNPCSCNSVICYSSLTACVQGSSANFLICGSTSIKKLHHAVLCNLS